MRAFDASALLALVFEEDGADIVATELSKDTGVCSAVNWSEVAQKVASRGDAWPSVRALLLDFGIKIEPVGQDDAENAASAWRPKDGLSLADRLCLALGQRLGATVVTADKAWAGRQGVEPIR